MKKNIRTERLTVIPYEPEDRENLIGLITDEIIKKGFMIPDYSTEAELSIAVDKLYNASMSDEHFERGIFLDNVLIGFVNDVEAKDGKIEIDYVIHPNFQSRGYATEVLRAVIETLLDSGYSVVTAEAFDWNIASIRVMEKSGMKKIRKEEDIFYQGRNQHCVFCSVSR